MSYELVSMFDEVTKSVIMSPAVQTLKLQSIHRKGSHLKYTFFSRKRFTALVPFHDSKAKYFGSNILNMPTDGK